MSWKPADVDRLERAILRETRVQISRRGTEYVLVPRALRSEGATDVLIATTVHGDDLRFRLDEIEAFDVLE